MNGEETNFISLNNIQIQKTLAVVMVRERYLTSVLLRETTDCLLAFQDTKLLPGKIAKLEVDLCREIRCPNIRNNRFSSSATKLH
jgi:hypothetical protein